MDQGRTLGFIGIGLMGEAITRRLLERGWRVTVWNLEPGRLETVVPHGAQAASSPAAVAAASDAVLLCVLGTDAVEACVFGPDGVAAAARKPALLIDLSTTDPEATVRMAQRLAAMGCHPIAAPRRWRPGVAHSGGWPDAPTSR